MSDGSLRFERLAEGNRALANHLLKERWHGTDMVIRGHVHDLRHAEGFLAYEGGDLCGLITFEMQDKVCEITSLDSLREGQGIGRALLRRCLDAALAAGCSKVLVVTTNDNTRALRFYQRQGFALRAFRRNMLNRSRELKPAIPLLGEDGISLQHELELEFRLSGEEGKDCPAETSEYQEAHSALLSTLHKCEKVMPKLKPGSPQSTLLTRRIRALEIALALIEDRLADGADNPSPAPGA